MEEPTSNGGVFFKYRIHWHVWLIHFPISFFVAAFIFQILHLFPQTSDSFEDAGNAMLIAGTAVLIPTTITGWVTWKNHFDGLWALNFPSKIVTSFIMLAISLSLSIWRTGFPSMFENVAANPWHWVYLFGAVTLMAGSALEGIYGIRLNHK